MNFNWATHRKDTLLIRGPKENKIVCHYYLDLRYKKTCKTFYF